MIPERIRRHLPRRPFPKTGEELESSDIFKRWWYYSMELLPGHVTKGQYPDDFPLLPRLMLRNCDLRGTACLDLGSMEGLIPVLMSRGGANSVLATDAVNHCEEKLAAIRHYYSASFDFQQVGLMYDLTRKLRKRGRASFDLINLSGLLYHVFSPLMVLAGARALLKKGGLLIVSTNVVMDDSFTMHFNSRGRLQEESNTFWYISLKTLDYMMRYLRLAPIDCVYLPHRDINAPVRYVTDVESGYCSVVCRAQEDVLPEKDDEWMRRSGKQSWEYRDLIDWDFNARQPQAQISYSGAVDKSLFRENMSAIDLFKAADAKTIHRADRSSDAHILKLSDRS